MRSHSVMGLPRRGNYQRTSIDGGADPFGRISYGATDEIYGRLGARFAKGWLTNDGRVVTTWAETNL